ncbi:SWIM zinc finger family protein [Bacillus sp. V3B]|nr:SWIM zinc finger family protein [Bacillus sp. V3B]
MIPESYVEPLQWFSEQTKDSLKSESPADAQIVQKGLLLYRQGSVSQIKLEHNAISAVVQDVTPVNVTLDLSLPYLSECSCPIEGMCRHQMAAFFQILSYDSSVSNWVDDWRKPLREQEQTKTLHIQRAKDLLQSTGHLKPDYTNWTEAFRLSFDAIMKEDGQPKPYQIGERFALYTRRLKAGAPFEQEWKSLYLLVAAVVTFEEMLELSLELEHNEDTINRYYRYLYTDLLEDIENLSSKLAVQSLPFAFDDFIEQLKDDTFELLRIHFVLEYDRTHLFRLLWTGLFKKKNWREEAKETFAAMPTKNRPTTVGLIHLHLLLREDEKALALIHKCDEEISPYFFYWLKILASHKEWKRMEPYVIEAISRIKVYLSSYNDYYACREFMKLVTQAITPFCVETNRLDLYEKALFQMLPYSFHDYEFFLFEKKEYDKWLELQTYASFNFESISNDRIKLLKSEAPHILLPLYHQAVQADIEGKNREHYRLAVRKLKKLRTLYKKMKRMDDWNSFLDALLTRTKRLRAFHEECKRGKLIDA